MAVNPMVSQFLHALATQQMRAPSPMDAQYPPHGAPLMPQQPAGPMGGAHQMPIQGGMPQEPAMAAPGEMHTFPMQREAPGFSAMPPGIGPMQHPEGPHGGVDPGFLVQDIMKRLAGQHRGGGQPQQPHQMPLQGATGY